MKYIGYTILIMIIIMIILPFFIVKGWDTVKRDDGPTIDSEDLNLTISVLNHRSKEVMNLPLEEYIMGVVAAEMPVTFEIEALKAQAVAARTYTVRRMEEFGATPNDQHPQYDMCTDHTHCQAWISKEDRIKAWKADKELGLLDYLSLWNKIEEAVTSTSGMVVTYNGQLIDPLFHSTSGGKTENSEDYFNAKVPYLRSVLSQYEDESPHMLTKTTMDMDEFIKKIQDKIPDVKIDQGNMEKEIEILEKTEGGQIGKIRIGNKILTGREAREALGLKSSNFSVDVQGKKVLFTVIGYGHGVGMSQYGADGMAKQGSSYQEIIKHYYQGVEIIHIRDM